MNWSVKDVMLQSWEEQGTAKLPLWKFLLRDSLVDILRFPSSGLRCPERPEEFLSFPGNNTGLFGI